jgi:hypothetical protein
MPRVLIDNVTPTQLASDSCARLFVKASFENSDFIAIGGSGVTVNAGWRLNPGDPLPRHLLVNNPQVLYALGNSAGQYLEYYLNP